MNNRPAPSSGSGIVEASGLGSAHERVGVQLVNAVLAEEYHLRGALEAVPTERDDTFRLRSDEASYLVKVSAPDEAEAEVALQTAAMRFLEDTRPDLPVQRVRRTVDGADHVVLGAGQGRTRVLRVFGFVEGTVWARTTPDAEQLRKLGRTLARVDTALAAFAHPSDGRALVWDLIHFHQLQDLVEHTVEAGSRRLAREVFTLFRRRIVPRLGDLEKQVIHGDFSPYNVVVDPRSQDFVTGVIDFGDTVRSAVIFDPAVSVANLLGRVPDQPWRDACAFVDGYSAVRPIKDEELTLLPVAALARLTLRALITNWRAGRVPERRDYLLEHARDDWLNVERALGVPLDDVVALLRRT